MRIFTLLFLFIVSSWAQSASTLEHVKLQLNWKYQFEFAGFIAAKEKGFYRDLGLDVEIQEFTKQNIIEDLKSNKTTYALYDLKLLSYLETEKPVILLANYFKRSALVFLTNQNIITPYDLKDKNIMASHDELKNSVLATLLEKFNIQVKDFNHYEHTFSADDFIAGKVNAMSAYVSNELYEVQKAKKVYNIIDPTNYGINGMGGNLFSSKEEIEQNPIKAKKFLDATKRGWEYALAHKEEMVDLIYEKYSKNKSKDALLFEAKEIEKLIMPNIYNIGEIDQSMLKKNLLYYMNEETYKNKFNIDDFIFNVTLENRPIETSLLFTPKEKTFLENKKLITMCIDPDWMPYEKIEEGKHIGMTYDYMRLIESKIGLPIKLVPTQTWAQSIEYAKQRKCDIFSLAMKTPSREKYMNFTAPYLTFPVVVATKTDKLFIADVEDVINTETLGVVKGYAFAEILKEKYPNNKLLEVTSVKEGLKMVAKDKVFGFVGTLATVGYEIQNHYIGELKIAGKFDEKWELGIGVRNDELELLSVFEKVIDTIDIGNQQKILNKWVSVKYENSIDYELMAQIVLFFLVIIIFIIFRNTQLKKYNAEIQRQALQTKKSNDELHKTQQKLEKALKSSEVLFDCVLDAVFVYDNQICIDVNDVAVKMLGYDSKHEMRGLHVKDFTHEDSFKQVRKQFEKSTGPYEVKVKCKNGSSFEAIVQGTNIVLNEREVRISALVDVSEVKKKEQLLMQQNKMAAMGEMIGNIAHQWRQPLNIISTTATGIKLQMEYDKEFNAEMAIKELDKLNNTVQHLSQTIDDFRNFFKQDKEKRTFSIKSILEKNIHLLEGMLEANRIELIYEEVENILITNFENEFLQALINIIYNAKDVLSKQEEERFIFVNVRKKDNQVEISIKDNGGGIDDSIIEHIFEPYFTTKHKSNGTGIGLYMTHQIIVEHMMGDILVQNVTYTHNDRNYTGAQFTVLLPL